MYVHTCNATSLDITFAFCIRYEVLLLPCWSSSFEFCQILFHGPNLLRSCNSNFGREELPGQIFSYDGVLLGCYDFQEIRYVLRTHSRSNKKREKTENQ